MRIVVDCFKQVKGAGKSIGIYNLALNLVQNMLEEQSKAADPGLQENSIIVIGNPYNECDFKIKGAEFVNITNYDPLNKVHCVIWELLAVSFVCRKLKADCVIFPRGFCALTHPVKDITIIHDLIPFYYAEHYPGFFNRLENAYIMVRLRGSAKSCRHIITISEASKSEIIRYFHVPEEKITVIYNGCNNLSLRQTEKEKKEPYIVAVTSGLPHKNAAGILKSYERYFELAEQPLRLVVIGIADTSVYELPDNVKRHITCCRYIKEDEDLHCMIANSSVFLFLSLAEGFGFPPIEAMQLQVPVICSNRSSLPEIVGDAAILVNPEDYQEVAEKLNALIRDSEKRQTLIKKGNENVRRFAWPVQAEKYWNVIKKTGGGK